MQTLKTKKEFDFVYKNGFVRYGKSFAIYVYKERAKPQNDFFNKKSMDFRESKKCRDFANAKDSKESAHTARESKQESKIGLSVSKKIGNAVTRNKIKRRARAILREFSQKDFREIASGFRIIFVAKEGINLLSFSELKGSFQASLAFALDKLTKGYKPHNQREFKKQI